MERERRRGARSSRPAPCLRAPRRLSRSIAPRVSPALSSGAVSVPRCARQVAVFSVCALVCLAVLVLRRSCLGFELGGPPGYALATACFFVGLWFTYIAASVLYSFGFFS